MNATQTLPTPPKPRTLESSHPPASSGSCRRPGTDHGATEPVQPTEPAEPPPAVPRARAPCARASEEGSGHWGGTLARLLSSSDRLKPTDAQTSRARDCAKDMRGAP